MWRKHVHHNNEANAGVNKRIHPNTISFSFPADGTPTPQCSDQRNLHVCRCQPLWATDMGLEILQLLWRSVLSSTATTWPLWSSFFNRAPDLPSAPQSSCSSLSQTDIYLLVLWAKRPHLQNMIESPHFQRLKTFIFSCAKCRFLLPKIYSLLEHFAWVLELCCW